MLKNIVASLVLSYVAADTGYGVYAAGTTQSAKDLLTVTNQMRTNPKSFIPKLKAMT